MSTRLRCLSTDQPDFESRFQDVLRWSAQTDLAIEERVKSILQDVRARGDDAVLEYTRRFDAVQATRVGELEISRRELVAALDGIGTRQRDALEAAAQRVRDYHERQLDACGRSWSYRDGDGTLLGQ